MVATPLLFAASEAVLIPRLRPAETAEFDAIADDGAPVIIAGFGRVGQIVGRVLRMQGIRFTALERDPGQVEVVRRFGSKVYFGDPARADLLRAAGAERARVLVVAIDDMPEALKVVEVARRAFPGLAVLSRARNRRHVHLLMDRGIEGIVRDTFHSSLRLSELVLEALEGAARAGGPRGGAVPFARRAAAGGDARDLSRRDGDDPDVQQAAAELEGAVRGGSAGGGVRGRSWRGMASHQ